MAAVRSTNEADLSPSGTPAPPMSVNRIKKPRLLEWFSPKCVLGCSILQILDGVIVIIVLIVFRYFDGILAAAVIGEALAGILGVTSHCVRNKDNIYIVIAFICGIVNRVTRILATACAIKYLYQSSLLGETTSIAIFSVWLCYLIIIMVLDVVLIYQAVQYGRTLNRMVLEQSHPKLENFNDILIYMSSGKSSSLQQGRLLHIGSLQDDADVQMLLDDECQDNLTAPEA